jgi:hypothetical protein
MIALPKLDKKGYFQPVWPASHFFLKSFSKKRLFFREYVRLGMRKKSSLRDDLKNANILFVSKFYQKSYSQRYTGTVYIQVYIFAWKWEINVDKNRYFWICEKIKLNMFYQLRLSRTVCTGKGGLIHF